MDLILLQKLLNVYSWLAASLIMVFVTAIAHFYQKKFGTRTFSYIYIVPIIVLIIPLLQIVPFFSFQSEFLELTGSISSFVACYFLYSKMVGVK
ncbi:Uncharacterised protein [uncultured archaeon]|nr:Uncharacterised protein [uncultured archaeon]